MRYQLKLEAFDEMAPADSAGQYISRWVVSQGRASELSGCILHREAALTDSFPEGGIFASEVLPVAGDLKRLLRVPETGDERVYPWWEPSERPIGLDVFAVLSASEGCEPAPLFEMLEIALRRLSGACGYLVVSPQVASKVDAESWKEVGVYDAFMGGYMIGNVEFECTLRPFSALTQPGV